MLLKNVLKNLIHVMIMECMFNKAFLIFVFLNTIFFKCITSKLNMCFILSKHKFQLHLTSNKSEIVYLQRFLKSYHFVTD